MAGVGRSVPRPAASPSSSRASASFLPLMIAISALVASVALALTVLLIGDASSPIQFGPVPVPLVTVDWFWASATGYVLTPVLTIAAYGWNAKSQRDGLRSNRDFALRPDYTLALTWIAAASLIVGAWHIVNLSVPISEWLGFA